MVIDFNNKKHEENFVNACVHLSTNNKCNLCPLFNAHDIDEAIIVTVNNKTERIKYRRCGGEFSLNR